MKMMFLYVYLLISSRNSWKYYYFISIRISIDGSLSLYTFGTIEKNGIIRMYDPETGNVGSIVGEKGIKK